jgi:S-adenosylmethionine-diacylglycerol 3-amino-3-carboxypropyl transferase
VDIERYGVLRRSLPRATRDHWDSHQTAIEAGVIGAGRFERYLAAFRRAVFPFVPGQRGVRQLLAATSLEEQARVYREQWDTRPWRALFQAYFSRAVLGRLGRDPAFFAQCELEDVGGHYLARARHAFTELPIWENPYLSTMLSGVVGTGALAPEYLRPEAHAALRARMDRVEVETATLDEALHGLPSASVDAFYLSDVFELAAPAEYEATLAEIARVGRPGARLCYWNNLVPRHRPDALAGRISSHAKEAERLFAQDRAFLYSRFVVESVRGAAP